MMCIPAPPWLPKFKGADDDLKYYECKKQTKALLAPQEISKTRKVAVLLGALAREAKRQAGVLEEEEKDKVQQVFLLSGASVWRPNP